VEKQDTEYKETFGESVLKAVCGMANSNGGVVIIGVSDDGTVKGIKIDNDKLKKITEKIVNKLGMHPEIELEKREGKYLLKIKVSHSMVPVSLNGKYYERIGNTTREMKPERLRQFFLKGANWDSLINGEAEFDEIDEETVKMFIRMANAKGRLTVFDENADTKTLFEHLKLSNKGRLTNAAIVLFGKDPQKYFLNAVLRVIRLKNEITPIGDRLIGGNLFKQVMEGEEATKNFLGVRYEIKELVREEIWDYPLSAIREALINALIHRDYFRWNVQTQIKIFDDYMWFYNIRKPLIVHIFYLAGFIEEMGSGTGRIIDNIKSAGLPEPEFKEEMGGLSVYFRKDKYTEEYLKKIGLNERQIKAVMYVKEKGKITNREYQKLTGISRQMATIDLKQLVEKGVLTKIGKAGAGVAYELTKLTNK